MSVFEKLAEIDAIIVRDGFQPVQDAVARWRGQSDHVLAVLCILECAGLGGLRMTLDPESAPAGVRLVGCALALAAALALHVHGRLMRNSGGPGLFATGLPMSVMLRACGVILFMTSLAALCVGMDTRPVVLNGLGDLLWLLGAFFAGCTLRKPASQRRERLAALYATSA